MYMLQHWTNGHVPMSFKSNQFYYSHHSPSLISSISADALSSSLPLCSTNVTKSVEEDKRFALTIENALTINSHLARAAQKFGWSAVVTIPLLYNASGTPLTMENLTINPDRINLRATCFYVAVAYGKPDYINLEYPDMNAVDIDPMNVEDDSDRFQLQVRLFMLAK